MRRWVARRYGARIMRWLYPADPSKPSYELAYTTERIAPEVMSTYYRKASR